MAGGGVSHEQLQALARDGIVVVELPPAVYGNLKCRDVATTLQKDMVAVPCGQYHARFLRDMRQFLHGFVASEFIKAYVRDSAKTRYLEQFLDTAVYIGDDGQMLELGPTLPQDPDDTYLAGFVNLAPEDQTIYYMPRSHMGDGHGKGDASDSDSDDSDDDSDTEPVVGRGEKKVCVPYGSMVLLVDTLKHKAVLLSDDMSDRAWCLKVGWRITSTRATRNTALSGCSLPTMLADMTSPARSAGDRTTEIAIRRVKSRFAREPKRVGKRSIDDESDSTYNTEPYTEAETDCFCPKREWCITSTRGPGVAGVSLN